MTTDERKPVDVLAVIGEARYRFVNLRDLAGFTEESRLTDDLREARAAMAELIEAGDNLLAKMSGGRDWSGHSDAFLARERFAAALARVGGAS